MRALFALITIGWLVVGTLEVVSGDAIGASLSLLLVILNIIYIYESRGE